MHPHARDSENTQCDEAWKIRPNYWCSSPVDCLLSFSSPEAAIHLAMASAMDRDPWRGPNGTAASGDDNGLLFALLNLAVHASID